MHWTSLALFIFSTIISSSQYSTTSAQTTSNCEPTVTEASGGLTVVQINELLKAHNDRRKAVNPPARVMPLLKWNTKLATFALISLSTCPGLKHTDSSKRYNLEGFSHVGENIAGGIVLQTGGPTAVVKLWDDQKVNYDLATGVCSTGAVCSYYTQLVWAATTDVGCAYMFCPALTEKYYWQCNYGPGGNYVG
eukprot:PhF_6_TR33695/c0_g1_i4/m.49412